MVVGSDFFFSADYHHRELHVVAIWRRSVTAVNTFEEGCHPVCAVHDDAVCSTAPSGKD